MKSICQQVQDLLAVEGLDALQGSNLRHFETCEDCQATFQGLRLLEDTFADLPQEDAPDVLVDTLLAHPDLMLPPKSTGARTLLGWSRLEPLEFWLRRPSRSLAAVSFLFLAVLAGWLWPKIQPQEHEYVAVSVVEESKSQDLMAIAEQRMAPSEEETLRGRMGLESNLRKSNSGEQASGTHNSGRHEIASLELDDQGVPMIDGEPVAIEEMIVVEDEIPIVEVSRSSTAMIVTPTPSGYERKFFSLDQVKPFTLEGQTDGSGSASLEDRQPKDGARLIHSLDQLEPDSEQKKTEQLQTLELPKPKKTQSKKTQSKKIQSEKAPAEKEQAHKAQENQFRVLGYVGGQNESPNEGAFADVVGLGSEQPTERARNFLAERESASDDFISPFGYWKNTYLPGDEDRTLSQLQDHLARATLPEMPRLEGPVLHEASRRPSNPFDPPADSALALYLNADRRAVAGPSRMLVQVGLQAGERFSSQRPPLDLALVLDLRGQLSLQDARVLRALAAALDGTRQVGDRFYLVVAGRPGGLVLTPETFRHGPLNLTLDRLLSSPEPTLGSVLDLPEALDTAFEALADAAAKRQVDFGSSLALLVTSQEFDEETSTRTRHTAQEQAFEGRLTSIVGVGQGVDPDDLEDIAGSGQGRLRWLDQPADAQNLIEDELAAYGEVAARAVRLRLRLAPGVKLVEVIGSHRLDTSAEEEVRRAEQGIDQQLSRDLGIVMDRGEDEAGIQIVIPSFHAGDHHVILLDVMVPGPGPILDAKVRYKDLVERENGENRRVLHLSAMEGGEVLRGPLERHVLKSFLAERTRQVLDEAARHLAVQQSGSVQEIQNATTVLKEHHALLNGLRILLPGFQRDPDFQQDLIMLDTYLMALESLLDEPPENLATVQGLSASLRFAAWLKIRSPSERRSWRPPDG